MSWGSARDRDDRRRSALPRLQKSRDDAARALESANRVYKGTDADAARKCVDDRINDLDVAEKVIENTNKNMGTGTAALGRRTQTVSVGATK